MSSIIADFFYHYYDKQPKLSAEEAEALIKKSQENGFIPTEDPKILDTRRVDTENGSIFYLNEDTEANYTVFYLHGGAYKVDFSPFHWRLIGKIIHKTNAEVIAPAYLLLPFGTYKEAFDLIIPLYQKYVEEHPERKIIIMGDSAGGGLSLAVTEQLKKSGIRMPDELILLSPWVDISMENPDMPTYEEKDPWLFKSGLTVCAEYWAGGLDLHDPHISPIYGDLSGIDHVTVFTGTNEMLYPDSVKFFNMLEQSDSNELIVAEDMLHVYPLMPIPEAVPTQKKIYEKIKR